MDFSNVDVIRINEMKTFMKKCGEKDQWFEIPGSSAKLLYKYIDSIEQTLEYLYEDKEEEEEEEECYYEEGLLEDNCNKEGEN